MKLLLFILRLLFFFLGAETGLWKHLGGIQANDQWKISADVAIENVNPDRILVDFRGEKIEIPRLFRQTREYENVVLCLFDPRGNGPQERHVYKDICRWQLTVAPDNAYSIIATIGSLDSVLKKIPSAVTMNIIYHGHGGQGTFYKRTSYEEFTKHLATLTTRIDNMNIDLNTCYGGGFWNSAYTTSLQMIRAVTSSSKDGSTPSRNMYMRSVNPPIFEKGHAHLEDMETFKTIQNLEKFQEIIPSVTNEACNDDYGETSAGIFVFYGHGSPLLQIPEINDMSPTDKLFNRYFHLLMERRIFGRNASELDITTTMLELGEDLDPKTLINMTAKYPNSHIVADALVMKINGKKFSGFEIEQARRVKVHVDPENFEKNGEVCGNNALSVLECREWAKKLDVAFIVKDSQAGDDSGPKGCHIEADVVHKFKLDDCTKESCDVIYNIGSDESNDYSAPACKTLTDFDDI